MRVSRRIHRLIHGRQLRGVWVAARPGAGSMYMVQLVAEAWAADGGSRVVWYDPRNLLVDHPAGVEVVTDLACLHPVRPGQLTILGDTRMSRREVRPLLDPLLDEGRVIVLTAPLDSK